MDDLKPPANLLGFEERVLSHTIRRLASVGRKLYRDPLPTERRLAPEKLESDLGHFLLYSWESCSPLEIMLMMVVAT